MQNAQPPIPEGELRAAVHLIRAQRWASLASINEDESPLASMVAYVPMSGLEVLLLHLSRLSRHTQNLLARPSASIAIGEPDLGQGDPQLLARISLQGAVRIIEREGERYAESRSAYLARLPQAEQLFTFLDFVLFEFVPDRAHYVGGFARAYAFGMDDLKRAAQT